MLTVAFCRDSPLAREGRKQQFAPHMQHLRSVMQDIRLAAPLATADGAAISDDDRLVASVFVIESPSLESASDLMAADPYTSQDVWRCVSLFTVSDEFGQWLSAPGQAAIPGRLYAALSSVDAAGLPYKFADTALFGARLQLERSLGNSALADPWHSVVFFAADSLGDAQAMLSPTQQVWSIPMTAGSWPTAIPFERC
jgi:uncharacterized protein YciI